MRHGSRRTRPADPQQHEVAAEGIPSAVRSFGVVASLGVMIWSMELSSGVFAPKEMGWEVPPPGGRVLCAGAPPEASVSGRPSQPTARRAAISRVSWGATEKRSPTTP
ncbi:hypothetical protein GCM10022232_92840 [Streptomyces plumbiresistens]|uniref:Uncharacterized protein n=1 Tax=Streptomyces plumbiresistens TaxID=511811 RepID=A0ABP7TWH4_9ACTN